MNKPPVAVPPKAVSTLVERSQVPAAASYSEYKPYLRRDFFHSCAYCNMSEAEAQAIRFVIDHYEPRNARPDLVHVYSNLMYTCDECNLRKGDRCPPEDARKAGYSFFRPDEQEHADHFEPDGLRLKSRTGVGEYTIEALDLNRMGLRRLRELRKRIIDCDEIVMRGVMALRSVHIDRLPPSLKGQVNSAIQRAQKTADELAAEIDDLLRSFAKSDLIDVDPEQETRAVERAARLEGMKVMHPGNWRAPRASKAKP